MALSGRYCPRRADLLFKVFIFIAVRNLVDVRFIRVGDRLLLARLREPYVGLARDGTDVGGCICRHNRHVGALAREPFTWT